MWRSGLRGRCIRTSSGGYPEEYAARARSYRADEGLFHVGRGHVMRYLGAIPEFPHRILFTFPKICRCSFGNVTNITGQGTAVIYLCPDNLTD